MIEIVSKGSAIGIGYARDYVSKQTNKQVSRGINLFAYLGIDKI